MTNRPERCPHERLNEDGICRACGADMRSGVDLSEHAPVKWSAAEWLARHGLADLSVHWPEGKPVPQIDYPSVRPQPTLTGLMEEYAMQVCREKTHSSQLQRLKQLAADICRQLETEEKKP